MTDSKETSAKKLLAKGVPVKDVAKNVGDLYLPSTAELCTWRSNVLFLRLFRLNARLRRLGFEEQLMDNRTPATGPLSPYIDRRCLW